MKTPAQNLLLLLALLAGFAQTARAAIAFGVTPLSVSNTYNGPITLQITGLTNTESVVVQKFLDANTNNVIDGADLLVQQFTLRDGTNSVIGGVTNFSVPGDLNSATGAITATLNFQNGDFMQNLVGNYLYKLSSPVGHFTPVTTNLTVTNFPFPQKFTGNVVSNSSTGATLSNAVVLLFPPPRPGHKGLGQPLAGTVANNAGAYSIMVPPGTYTLMAFKSNYVVSIQQAPVLTLAGSQTISTNLTVTNATASISGKMVDAANNAIVLPGVFMPVQSTNGLMSFSFSDTNGSFTARVTASEWELGSDDSGLIIHGYLGLNKGLMTNSGATGVMLAFPKANALFYGLVTNNLGIPMVGLDMDAYETVSNLYQADGYTDTNGSYYVGVAALGTNDSWQVGPSSDSTPTNYIFSQPAFEQNGGTNLNAGQTVPAIFTSMLATNQITGNVKDSSGANIAGLGVMASETTNGAYFFQYVDTDNNGNYALNVANGTWTVGVECYGGSDSLSQLGNYACPNNVTVSVTNNNATTNLVVQLCGGVLITTPSPLPVGELNVFYSQSIQASDCSGNYNWSQSGGTLPGNLGLFSGGQFYTLSGNPNTSGTFMFAVQVNDGSGHNTNQQFSVTISNAVQITTSSLPNGTNGLNYSQQLQGAAGVPYAGPSPYSWSLFSGSLPGNVNLASNGLLSGSPTNSGLFNFTVQAGDSLGATCDQPLSLNIVSTNSGIAPPVGIVSAGGEMLVYYPSSGSNFVLQTATNLAGPWVPAANGVSVIALSFSNTAPVQFYRLH